MLTLTEDLKGSVIYEKTDSRKKEIYFLTVHVKDHESQKLVFGWLTLGSFCRSVWGTAPGRAATSIEFEAWEKKQRQDL